LLVVTCAFSFDLKISKRFWSIWNCATNKGPEMPVLFDENSLTKPGPRPELASRPGRWESIAPSADLVDELMKAVRFAFAGSVADRRTIAAVTGSRSFKLRGDAENRVDELSLSNRRLGLYHSGREDAAVSWAAHAANRTLAIGTTEILMCGRIRSRLRSAPDRHQRGRHRDPSWTKRPPIKRRPKLSTPIGSEPGGWYD
jgi:hypothetical protein